MNEQELNKKLAEWAGFEFSHRNTGALGRSADWWIYPNGGYTSELPGFTQSLDACFKWLVPKLNNCELTSFHKSTLTLRYHFTSGAKEDGNTYWSYGNTPALALCLAIEKLIDSEVVSATC